MGTADRLEALRQAALLDVDQIDDDVLLAKNLDGLAEHLARERYLDVPRLHRALITPPRGARKGDPGNPGREHALVVKPATRVELWLLVDGFSTLAALSEGGDLDLGEARLDAENQCLSFAYLAERPSAKIANEYFQGCLDDAEARMESLGEQVTAYNRDLLPALREALAAARSRAKQRQTFAAALEIPQPSRA